MSWVATGIVGGLALFSGYQKDKAAKDAARAQTDSAMASVEEQRRQFDALQENMSPYMDAGSNALQGQLDYLGLNGQEAQQQSVDQVLSGPLYNSMLGQAEQSLINSPNRPGGFRGGNTSRALAELRPNLMSSLLQQRYGQLSGLTNMGQNSAAGVGSQGMNMATNIGNQNSIIGAAGSGRALARGDAISGVTNDLSSMMGFNNGGGGGGGLGSLFGGM